jgi:hypothetical protein
MDLNDVLGEPLFMNCNNCHFIICLYIINEKKNYKSEVMPLMELKESHAIAIVGCGYIIDDVI